jgi:hypothetical protein
MQLPVRIHWAPSATAKLACSARNTARPAPSVTSAQP